MQNRQRQQISPDKRSNLNAKTNINIEKVNDLSLKLKDVSQAYQIGTTNIRIFLNNLKNCNI